MLFQKCGSGHLLEVRKLLGCTTPGRKGVYIEEVNMSWGFLCRSLLHEGFFVQIAVGSRNR